MEYDKFFFLEANSVAPTSNFDGSVAGFRVFRRVTSRRQETDSDAGEKKGKGDLTRETATESARDTRRENAGAIATSGKRVTEIVAAAINSAENCTTDKRTITV